MLFTVSNSFQAFLEHPPRQQDLQSIRLALYYNVISQANNAPLEATARMWLAHVYIIA